MPASDPEEQRPASRTGTNWYKVVVIVQLVLVGLLLTPMVLVASCQAIAGEGGRNEVERITSPGGKTDAVLVQRVGCCGALSGVSQELYVAPTGTEDLSDMVSKIDGLNNYKNLELRWRSEGFLEVRYPAAQVWDFRNYASLENEQGEQYVIEVRLAPPEDELSLPPYFSEEVPGEQTLLE